MDSLEEIKGRLSIEEVVGQYVQLQKAGRNFKALCPFHTEKTPSFVISPDKGIAYCFGCQKGGDIFKFVQLVENVSFPEAVQILAERAGVQLPTFSKEKQEAKKQVLEINEAVTRFYEENLAKNPDKKTYLSERGLSEKTLKDFRLGYSPDSFEATYDFLLKQGFSRLEIVNSGLGGSKDTANNEIYDRFRGRIMFPITNVLGNVIAFGGRTLKKDKEEAKYLNSPDSPTYNKSLVLYGLDKAKEAIRKENNVVIVEGYMDVIASHQAGICNVVASSGTALTSEQIKLLKRYTKNFIFVFDMDQAGQTAAERAIDTVLSDILKGVISNDINLFMVKIPNGKDPDECIREDLDLWKNALQNKEHVMDFLLNHFSAQYDISTIEGKKMVANSIYPFILRYPNSIDQHEYTKKAAQFLQIDDKIFRSELLKVNLQKVKQHQKEKNVQTKTRISREKYLLGMLLLFPKFYETINHELVEKIFLDKETKRFYKIIKSEYNPPRKFDVAEFLNYLEEEEKEALVLWQLFVEDKYKQLPEEMMEQEFKKVIREINKTNLSQVKKKLVFDLKEAKLKDPEEYLLVLNQYNQVLKLNF